MDAKMRANFINSVGIGKKIPCPSCNTLNDANSNFCRTCGTKLGKLPSPANEIKEKTAFTPVKGKESSETEVMKLEQEIKKPEKNIAFKFVEPIVEEEEEPASVFAQGLPSWDIVPPQIMVRRKDKR